MEDLPAGRMGAVGQRMVIDARTTGARMVYFEKYIYFVACGWLFAVGKNSSFCPMGE